MLYCSHGQRTMKEEIKQLISLMGVSGAEFGEVVGVSRQTVHDWLSGKFSPCKFSRREIKRVARKFKREQREKEVNDKGL